MAALSPREVPKLLDQLRSLFDPDRKAEINTMAAALLAREALELAQEQQTFIADFAMRWTRAEREKGDLVLQIALLKDEKERLEQEDGD